MVIAAVEATWAEPDGIVVVDDNWEVAIAVSANEMKLAREAQS